MLTEHPRPEPTKPPVTGSKRVLFLALAGVFFVLGAAGAILPILPTTPFLLLTSYFLLRTSPKLNERLLRSRFFGPILRDWQERKGVQRHVKVKAIVIVTVVLSATIIFTSAPFYGKCMVGALGLIGILVVIRLPEIDA